MELDRDAVVIDAWDSDVVVSGDRRTRAYRDAEVLAKVKADGGFTCFWILDAIRRSYAETRLRDKGVIRPVEAEWKFPWCAYELVPEEEQR